MWVCAACVHVYVARVCTRVSRVCHTCVFRNLGLVLVPECDALAQQGYHARPHQVDHWLRGGVRVGRPVVWQSVHWRERASEIIIVCVNGFLFLFNQVKTPTP